MNAIEEKGFLIGHLLDARLFPYSDYFQQFVEPLVVRAVMLGLSDNDVNRLWSNAWHEGLQHNQFAEGYTPAVLFAAKLDTIEWRGELP